MKTASHSNTNESPLKGGFSTEKTGRGQWDVNTPWGEKRKLQEQASYNECLGLITDRNGKLNAAKADELLGEYQKLKTLCHTIGVVFGVIVFIISLKFTIHTEDGARLSLFIAWCGYMLAHKIASAKTGYERFRGMKRVIKDAIFLPALNEVYEGATFDEVMTESTNKHSADIINVTKEYGIVNKDSNTDYTNYLSFPLGDCTVHEFSCHAWHTSGSGKNKSTVTTYRGTQIMIDKPLSGLDGVVRIIASHPRKGAITKKVKNESTYWKKKIKATPEHVDVNNEFFDNYFEVWAESTHDAFYVLNPYVVEKLAEMRLKYVDFMMCVTDDFISISFTGEDLFLNPDYDSALEAESLIKESQEGIGTVVDELSNLAEAISRHKDYDLLKDVNAVEA